MLEAVLEGRATTRSRASRSSCGRRWRRPRRDVLAADGFLLGTPANFGYMSRALKHFFDTIYYPCLDATVGRPFGVVRARQRRHRRRAASDRAITGGLRWKLVRRAGRRHRRAGPADLEACWELGAALAAGLMA